MAHNNGLQGSGYSAEMSHCYNRPNSSSSTNTCARSRSYNSNLSLPFNGGRVEVQATSVQGNSQLSQNGVPGTSFFPSLASFMPLTFASTSTGLGMSSASTSTSTSTGWGRVNPSAPTLTGFRMPSTPTRFHTRRPVTNLNNSPKTYCLLCPGYVNYFSKEESKEDIHRRARLVDNLASQLNQLNLEAPILPNPDYYTAANFPLCTSCEVQLEELDYNCCSRDRYMDQAKLMNEKAYEVLAKLQQGAIQVNGVKKGLVQSCDGPLFRGYTTFTDMVAAGVINQEKSNNSLTLQRFNQPGPSFFNGGRSTSTQVEGERPQVNLAATTATATRRVSTATAAINVEQGAAAIRQQNFREAQADDGADVKNNSDEEVLLLKATKRRAFSDGREIYRLEKNGKEYLKCNACEFQVLVPFGSNPSRQPREKISPRGKMNWHMVTAHPRLETVGPQNVQALNTNRRPYQASKRKACTQPGCEQIIAEKCFQEHVRRHLVQRNPQPFKKDPGLLSTGCQGSIRDYNDETGGNAEEQECGILMEAVEVEEDIELQRNGEDEI